MKKVRREGLRKTLTTFEAAKLFNVVPSTVIRWCRNGTLKSHKTLGGHRRIKYEDLKECMEKNGLPFYEEDSAN